MNKSNDIYIDNSINTLATPSGVTIPIVPWWSKFVAYKFPALSTAGPSTSTVKLLAGVKTDALNNSVDEDDYAFTVKGIPARSKR